MPGKQHRAGVPPQQLEAALKQLLDLGGVDLSARAERGELAAAHGRERELERVFAALVERRSVLLLGSSGVGKTAILYEAATRMVGRAARVPDPLHGKRVVQFSTSTLEAGARNAGEWNQRLQALLAALKQAQGAVFVYLDNIWHLPNAGRYTGMRESFATALRPHLENGSLVLLGESTEANFAHAAGQDLRRGFALADDPSLVAQFLVVKVDEPDLAATHEIVQIVGFELEDRYGVRLDASVVDRVVELVRRFQPYEAFPGKAIRLLELVGRAAADAAPVDQAPARTPRVVSTQLVTERFAALTGLPERLFSDAVPITADEVRSYFAERVVGQDDAVATIVDLVTLIKAELTDPHRPLGVLLFVGPTGSGKTFLAKTLAEYLFGSEAKLVRFDMSEYQSPASVVYLGRQLTERLRQQQFSIVLLDEIEKAAPNIFDLFLQAFDDARLSDPEGVAADLRNVVFVMTSNLGGGSATQRGLGFPSARLNDPDAHERAAEDSARRVRAVHAAFRPEFVNRLDRIVTFRPLGLDAMRRIAGRELGKALEREGIRRRGFLLDFSEPVLDVLLEAGFSEEFGARPLQRAIKDLVLVPIAHLIAAQPSATAQLLDLRAEAGRVVMHVLPLETGAAPAEDVEAHAAVTEAPASVTRPRPAFQQLKRAISEVQQQVAQLIDSPHFKTVQARASALMAEMARPSFWDDHERARRVNGTTYHLARTTERLIDLRRRIDALAEVPAILERHRRTEVLAELDRLEGRVRRIQHELGLVRLELLAAAAVDAGDVTGIASLGAWLQIEPAAAAGAREAGDWPAVLCGMYAGWARRRDYEAGDAQSGVDGSYRLRLHAPGLAEILAGEVGVHKRQQVRPGERGRRPAVSLARVSLEPDGLPARRGEEVVRVYHLGAGAYVRDPRTDERSAHPRDVLAGAIEPFLLAYLAALPFDPGRAY